MHPFGGKTKVHDTFYKFYGDEIRVERQPLKLGGKWRVYKLVAGRYNMVSEFDNMDTAFKAALKAGQ